MKAGSCFSKTLAMSESSASSFSLSESPAFLLCGMEREGREGGREGGEGESSFSQEYSSLCYQDTHNGPVHVPVIIIHPKSVLFSF